MFTAVAILKVRTVKRWVPLTTLLTVAMLATSAMAAPAIDSGSILREQQTLPGLKAPTKLPAPEDLTSKPATLGDTGTKVIAKKFVVNGVDGMVSNADLQNMLAAGVGREFTFTELNRLAESVTNFLRDRGFFLATAYLPQQDVTEGVITIAVLSGKTDEPANVVFKEPRRLRDQTAAGIVNYGVKTGAALHENSLERSLLTINDIPGVAARSYLDRGVAYGTTRVQVEVAEGPLLAGGLALDNFGNRYTGEYRASANLALNDPFGIGDRFDVNGTASEGLFDWHAGYTTLLAPCGLKGGIAYTGLTYKLGEDLKSLDVHGRANTLSANLLYPIYRSRAKSLYAGLLYEYRALDDFAGDVKTKERQAHAGTVNVQGSLFDGMFGGGMTTGRVAMTTGSLDLGVAADAAGDAATAATAGSYYKFNYSASRLQRLNADFSLFASAAGQLAGGNLDSSEKFILGGPNGLRAYPVGEGSGDSGHLLTTELRYDIPGKFFAGSYQVVGFFDAGTVTQHHRQWANSVSSATGENSYWLSGAGLGLNANFLGHYALNATWATALGDNPGRTVTGNNSDNRANDNRFWLQASAWF